MTTDTLPELKRRVRELDEEIDALRRERQRLADAIAEREHRAPSDADAVMARFVASSLAPQPIATKRRRKAR